MENDRDTVATDRRIALPEPDPDNITVLTRELPNDPILPWHHYDSPWLGNEPETSSEVPEATDALVPSVEGEPDVAASGENGGVSNSEPEPLTEAPPADPISDASLDLNPPPPDTPPAADLISQIVLPLPDLGEGVLPEQRVAPMAPVEGAETAMPAVSLNSSPDPKPATPDVSSSAVEDSSDEEIAELARQLVAKLEAKHARHDNAEPEPERDEVD